MFFKRAKKNTACSSCGSGLDNNKFSFCPHCGISLKNKEKDVKDFGILGRNDMIEEEIIRESEGFGITDKIIGSLVNNLMKNLDKQFKELERTDINNMPRGIKIKIGPQQHAKKTTNASVTRKNITDEQVRRMSSLPRATAKTNIRRLSDKMVYELTTPGLESPQDVFISKIESGYEIKAIGNKKIYVNSLPINLPLRGMSIDKNKLSVEFKLQEE